MRALLGLLLLLVQLAVFVPARAPAQAPAQTNDRVIVAFGDSLTSGLGVPADQTYPALLGERLRREGYGYKVVNAGVSGDTTAGGLRRVDWLLREPIRVLVLELGANDMLRGQDLAAMRGNLQQIVDRTRARNPDVRIVIAGMQSPPNLGEAYAQGFAQSFVDLAAENRAALIPFLLDGVAAVPELNQADGIHPTAEGYVDRGGSPVALPGAAAAQVGRGRPSSSSSSTDMRGGPEMAPALPQTGGRPDRICGQPSRIFRGQPFRICSRPFRRCLLETPFPSYYMAVVRCSTSPPHKGSS